MNRANGTAVRAISLLWIGSVCGAGCAFLTQVLLARELGPAAFGRFAATLGMVMLVAPLGGFGVGGLWLKVFGHEGWGAIRWLSGSLRFSITSSSLVIALLLGWAMHGPHDVTTRNLLTVLSACVLGQASMELVGTKLQLEGRYIRLALWQLVPHLSRLLLIAIMVFAADALLTAISAAYTYATVSIGLFSVAGVLLYRMYGGQLALQGHGPPGKIESGPGSPLSMRKVAAEAWPYGLAGVFYLIYFQSDIILLKYIAGDDAAGIYNVAFIIMAAVYLLPSVVYQRFLLPKFHRWANHDREKFYRTYRAGSVLMLIIGLVAMFAIWLLAPYIIDLLFGHRYEESVSALMILSVAIPIRFLASSAGAALSTQHHVMSKIVIMAVGAATNVLLNLAVIPEFGVKGAASTTVVTELFLAFAIHRYARRNIFIEFFRKR